MIHSRVLLVINIIPVWFPVPQKSGFCSSGAWFAHLPVSLWNSGVTQSAWLPSQGCELPTSWPQTAALPWADTS